MALRKSQCMPNTGINLLGRISETELRTMFIDRGMSATEMSKALGVGRSSVQAALKHFNIRKQFRLSGEICAEIISLYMSGITTTKLASEFGVSFYCITGIITKSGKRRSRRAYADTRKAVDRMCTRLFTLNGYPCVWLDGKIQYLHRLVVEHRIGRRLTPDEIVHHKDNDRTNFTDSNLELTSKSNHGRHHALERPAPRNRENGQFTPGKHLVLIA
jgi:DNA-binding Xre family transcriptional regulator